MPTYEYACTECGDRLEAVQSFSDDPLTVCPSCKGRLRKVFSPVGVVFKAAGNAAATVFRRFSIGFRRFSRRLDSRFAR